METYISILNEVNSAIKNFRDNCSHPPETLYAKPGGDTGNWCKSDDAYWQDYVCGECSRSWREYYKDGVPYGGYTPAIEVDKLPNLENS